MPHPRGLQAITETFARSKAEGRASFMPFWTVGYPDFATSINMLELLAQAGADALEVGMPFSDPLADGAVIQHASQIALNNGTRIEDCLSAVRTLRERGVTVPAVLMGYLNPLLAYGLDRFVADAAAAGADAFIVPDLPPEEAAEMLDLCATHERGFIMLVAPNSPGERLAQATSMARGFIYLVAVMGVTGARDALPSHLSDYVARVRALTDKPLAVGFGISKPEHAQQVAKIADGVVVASALIRQMESSGADAVRELAASLRAACAN